jgi:hypothetical protein
MKVSQIRDGAFCNDFRTLNDMWGRAATKSYSVAVIACIMFNTLALVEKKFIHKYARELVFTSERLFTEDAYILSNNTDLF